MFLLINIVCFLMMGIDKACAIAGSWRTSEFSLFLVALAGGAIGGTLGMFVFNHKTRHRNFRLGFPALAFVQALVFVLF